MVGPYGPSRRSDASSQSSGAQSVTYRAAIPNKLTFHDLQELVALKRLHDVWSPHRFRHPLQVSPAR
jgi:hypothetical protein